MDERLLEILKKIRYTAKKKKLVDFSFTEIEEKTGIKKKEIKELVKDEEELVEKLLEIDEILAKPSKVSVSFTELKKDRLQLSEDASE